MKRFALLFTLLASCASANELMVADMASSNLNDWQHKSFSGETDYQLVELEGERVLRAISQGSASGLVIEHSIDLNATPYLNWRWRVDAPLLGLDEQSKQGDDYAARIYVVVSGGVFFWNSKALNYVWSGSQAIDSYWDNAYTKQAKMLAVESGAQYQGQWRHYRRDVAEDMRRLFGEAVTHIDAIAIMTDTDNSRQQATSYYGSIYFSSE